MREESTVRLTGKGCVLCSWEKVLRCGGMSGTLCSRRSDAGGGLTVSRTSSRSGGSGARTDGTTGCSADNGARAR